MTFDDKAVHDRRVAALEIRGNAEARFDWRHVAGDNRRLEAVGFGVRHPFLAAAAARILVDRDRLLRRRGLGRNAGGNQAGH